MDIPRDIKQQLKRALHRTRTSLTQRLFAFNSSQLLELLRRLGVRPGDVVCVHSAFDQFLGFQGNVGDALKVLQQAVGEEGGLMMPTQPFTSTAIDYVRKHPVTDIARAPSMVGMITEILRRTPGAVRSINPTHPVAVWGQRGIKLADRDWEAGTPCGRGTAYRRFGSSRGYPCRGKTVGLPSTVLRAVGRRLGTSHANFAQCGQPPSNTPRLLQGKVARPRMRRFVAVVLP